MKKTVFLLVILLASVLVKAQNKTLPGSFTIKNLEDKSKLEFYVNAIENASFEELRLKNKSQEFKFENGFVLELTSATELKNKGVVLNVESYKEQLDADFNCPLFLITDAGKLVALYNSIPTKTELKNNSTK